MLWEVKWFKDERGSGFIEYKDNGNILIHYSTTKENEDVELELIKTDNNYIVKK